MIKLGIKEFQRNISSNIFIILQLAATIILTVAIVSSVQSRSIYYKPFADMLDKDGVVLKTSATSDNEQSIEELSGVDSACLSYMADGIFSTDGTPKHEGSNYPTALNDEYIKRLSPDMKSGKWLSDVDCTEQGKIYGVITDDGITKTGDTVLLSVGYYDESDTAFENILYETYEIEIVGVIRDGAKILDVSNSFKKTEYDYRNLYHDYSFKQDVNPVLFVPYSQMNLPHLSGILKGVQIVNFKENLSESEKNDLKTQLGQYGTVIDDTKNINERSLKYINGEMIKLMPLLICIFVLVAVSSVSLSALRAKKNLKLYGIYYVCGSKWNNCILINLINNTITSVAGILTALIAVNIIKIKGLLANTIFTFGGVQLLFVLAVILLNLLISMLMPIGIMRRNTPKEILTNNE
jgi:hypothetical protein